MKKLAVFIDMNKLNYFVCNIEETEITSYAKEHNLSYTESIPKAKKQIAYEKHYRELLNNGEQFSFKDSKPLEWSKLKKIYAEQNAWARSLLTETDKAWAKQMNRTPLDIRREQNKWAREHIREFGEE